MQVNEKWTEACEKMKKPLARLTELNMNTWAKIVKENNIESFMNAKTPEQIISSVMDSISNARDTALIYTQKMCDIMLEGTSEMSETACSMMRETSMKASADMRSATQGKKQQKQDQE